MLAKNLDAAGRLQHIGLGVGDLILGRDAGEADEGHGSISPRPADWPFSKTGLFVSGGQKDWHQK
jgi:hypothetical protein